MYFSKLKSPKAWLRHKHQKKFPLTPSLMTLILTAGIHTPKPVSRSLRLLGPHQKIFETRRPYPVRRSVLGPIKIEKYRTNSHRVVHRPSGAWIPDLQCVEISF